MISTSLQKARVYEALHGSRISPEERPAFHLTPRVGWMNDPNGFSFYQGLYHLFYQYHPYSTRWNAMHWGHAVSRDLLHWEYLPAAMAPDTEYDGFGCFSGTALALPDGRHMLMYTGVRKQGDEEYQTQCMAVGDGENYEKYSGNPVLTGADVPAGFSARDFRDPKLWQEDGKFYCVVADRTDDGSGAALLYESGDGFRWNYVTILDRSRNQLGKMWECPDFFVLDGKQILMVNPQEMEPEGLEFVRDHNSLVLLGTYDPAEKKFTRECVQVLDYGLDFYAPQSLLAPDGRRILVGWLQNWGTVHPAEDAKWFSQMTLPRELTLRDGKVIQKPVKEIEGLHGSRVFCPEVQLTGEQTLPGVQGRLLDLTVEVSPAEGGYRQFAVKLAQGGDWETVLTYDPGESLLTIDRSRSGNPGGNHVRSCLVRNREDRIKLRILLDRFSAEVFVNDGEQALSAVLYTPLSADGISFCADGTVCLTAESYTLAI